MSWTDEEIDKLFQDRAEDLSFEYKNDYWNEFNSSLSDAIPTAGIDADALSEIDRMYQEEAAELSFEYKHAYWQEMEAMLARSQSRDFLWYATAAVFVGLLMFNLFTDVPQSNFDNSRTLTSSLESLTQGGSENTSDANEKAAGQVEEGNVFTGDLSLDNGVGDVIPDPIVNDAINGTSLNLEPIVGIGENNANKFEERIVDPSVDDVNESENSDRTLLPGDNTIIETIARKRPDAKESMVERKELNNALNDELAIGSVDALQTRTVESGKIEKDIVDLQEKYPLSDLKLPTRSMFFVELNGGLSQSLITPSDRMSYSAGGGIGAQFEKGRFVFTTGVNANVSFHDDLVLSRQAKVYGFGSEVFKYTLKYDQIYSLEANLSVGYRFGNHRLNVGVRPSYAFGSKVGFTQHSDTDETGERQTVYGHMDGIQRLGVKPMIGYAFDIRSFTIGVNVGAQLMPAVNEEFINGKNNQLPIDGQLYIRKNISFRR